MPFRTLPSGTRFVVSYLFSSRNWKILVLYPHDPKIFVYSPTCAARLKKALKHPAVPDGTGLLRIWVVSHAKVLLVMARSMIYSLNWHSAQFQSFLSGYAAGLTLHVSHILPAGISILTPAWCSSCEGVCIIRTGRPPTADAPLTEENAAATLADLALLPSPICWPFAVPTLAGDLLSACLPAVPALPIAIVTARTCPDCARRFTARTAGPRAARAAAAAVGAGLAAGTARASCPPPASFRKGCGDSNSESYTCSSINSASLREFSPWNGLERKVN